MRARAPHQHQHHQSKSSSNRHQKSIKSCNLDLLISIPLKLVSSLFGVLELCLRQRTASSLSAWDFGESVLTLPRPDTTSRPAPRAFPLRVTGRRRDITASASAVAARPADGPWRASAPEEQSSWVYQEDLDDWIFRSVKGIMRDLRQAPLFVHVYSNGGDVSLVTEKSVKEGDWEKVKGEWEKGDKALPEGVIFVEELADDEERMEGSGSGGRDVARTWGLVVQGRGGKRGPPVCYLMKTSRVGSGTGVWSTHFFLVRVSGFRVSARSQLMNLWLAM